MAARTIARPAAPPALASRCADGERSAAPTPTRHTSHPPPTSGGNWAKVVAFEPKPSPTSISSPYQAGGPQGAGPETTFGFKKSDGPVLALENGGYKADVAREKAAFEVSAKIVKSQVRE